MYPLRFRPIFRRYVWGGRRLETVLGKTLGDGDHYAESWEVVDHGDDQSVVEFGELAEATLHELVQDHGRDLLGRHHPQRGFPLLFKFLDAQQRLSVQVHPNDAQAARLNPPDRGKTEAWVVLDAEPGSVIYAGLKRGFDRPALAREVARQTTELCLHELRPQAGDCIFLPAGTVHAIGAGLVIAEIQQASDTTFRLYDWNRVGKDGRARDLHIEQALDVIDYDRGPVGLQTPRPAQDPRCEQLVACQKFVLQRWRTSNSVSIDLDRRAHLVTVIEGSVMVAGDPSRQPLRKGQTILAPAACEGLTIVPHQPAILLQAFLP